MLILLKMREINFFESVPKSDKKVEIGERKFLDKVIARHFDERFFTGGGKYGYRNYTYDGRWRKVVEKMKEIYKIDSNSSVLDIGCANGYLLHDLQEMIPGIRIAGFDVSGWAINNAMRGYGEHMVKQGSKKDLKKLEKIARDKIIPHLIIGDDYHPWKLPWADESFDLVVNINTVHNLPPEQCFDSIREMIRVSKNKKKMFIQVDSYRNDEEKRAIDAWNLTGLTIMSTKEWLKFFKKCEYKGDYYWSIIRFEKEQAVKL